MEQMRPAYWMWDEQPVGDVLNKHRMVYFRKVIELCQQPEEMVIKISADAKYKLQINGELVNVGPQKGDHTIRYYDELDVASYLKAGLNVFLVTVLSIPIQHQQGNFGFFRTETPGLYIDGSYRIDSQSYPFKHEGWRCHSAQVIFKAENEWFAPLHIFETMQGDANLQGVFDGDYDDVLWKDVKCYDERSISPVLKTERLKERQIPFLVKEKRAFEGISAIRSSNCEQEQWDDFLKGDVTITIPPNSKEVVEISAGEETTGYLKLIMTGGKNAKLRILTSEAYAYDPDLDKDGPPVPRKGDRTDSINGKLFGFVDEYIPHGEGMPASPENYEPFWFRTFRYIQLTIETGDEPLTLHGFNYTYTAYPLEVISKVQTSDSTMASIWDISERTLRLCMHETYEDCPFYEQLQYAMDSRSQILYTYATSADDRLARQCMDDFRRAARHDGIINCSFPNYEKNVIPGFAIYYIGMIYDHMMYFGDKDLIRHHIPTVIGILNYFRNHRTDEGLVKKIGGPLFTSEIWSFIDWTSEWRETAGVPLATHTGPLTMESLLYVMGLQYAEALFGYIGYDSMAQECKVLSMEVQSAVNEYCRGEGGMYTDGPGVNHYSQHTQVFALLTETVGVDEGKTYLEETLTNTQAYAQCSVAMMFYLFRALEKCDMYEYTDQLWDIWREMVNKNLTTCEEDSVMSRSDCHAWGSLILYELPSVVLGVRPSKPGYGEVAIKPVSGKLKWAKGEVMTPKGMVSVSWEKGEDGLIVRASVPDGIDVSEQLADPMTSLSYTVY